MPKITFMPNKQSFDVPSGPTILVAAIRNGITIPHECTEGICGTDLIKILQGMENLSEKGDNESITLDMLECEDNDRLSCSAKVLGDVVVEIPT